MTETAMKRSLICCCLLMILGSPGHSQIAKATPVFYIVLNSLTKNCRVVDRMPRTNTPDITVACAGFPPEFRRPDMSRRHTDQLKFVETKNGQKGRST